ncbi:hypothetical protein Slin14017_G043090 [Septoria linicola]|nr:hypothetical protein Slin14017_G043090 [Septoria linicola]
MRLAATTLLLILGFATSAPLPDFSSTLPATTSAIESAHNSTTFFFFLPTHPHPITPHHQSCTATDNLFFISYSIHVGIPYSASRCEALKYKLKAKEEVSWWECVDDDDSDGNREARNGKGMIRLWFNAGRGREEGVE